MTPPDTAPPFDSPLVLRDALVRGLCFPTQPDEEPRGHLANVDNTTAVIILRRETFPLYLIAWDPLSPHPYDDVTFRLERIARGSRIGVTHVVLCGGPRDAQRVLERKNTFRLLERRLVVHHVLADGEIWDAGESLKLLKQVVHEQVAIAATGLRVRALEPGEVFVLREAFRTLVEAEKQFERRLERERPIATVGLLALFLAVFMLENVWGSPETQATLYRLGAIVPDRVLAGEVWRLFSGTLLHGGLGHLLVNAWGLWALGSFVERLLGRSRFVLLYAAAALGGSLLSSLRIEYMSVGASGAIFGLLGAVLALVWRPNPLVPPSVAANIKRTLWPILAVNVVFSLMPQVDASAHLGGFLTGLLLTNPRVLTRGLAKSEPGAPAPRALRILATSAMVLLVGSVGAAIAIEHPWELVQPPRLERTQLGDTGLSVGIPHGLRRPFLFEDEAQETFTFGLQRRDLVVIGVLVGKELVTDVAAELEAVERDPHNMDDLRVGQEPRRETIDGYPTVIIEGERVDRVDVQRWFTIRRGRFVRVEVAVDASADMAWKSVGDAVFDSLRGP